MPSAFSSPSFTITSAASAPPLNPTSSAWLHSQRWHARSWPSRRWCRATRALTAVASTWLRARAATKYAEMATGASHPAARNASSALTAIITGALIAICTASASVSQSSLASAAMRWSALSKSAGCSAGSLPARLAPPLDPRSRSLGPWCDGGGSRPHAVPPAATPDGSGGAQLSPSPSLPPARASQQKARFPGWRYRRCR